MMFKCLCRRLHSTSPGQLPAQEETKVDSNEKTSISEVVVTPDGKRKQNEDMNDPPPKKIKRFELGGTDTECTWELPQGMLDYVHKYMATHASEKDIKDHILLQNPVPINLKKVPGFDSYIKELLMENNKSVTLKNERVLKSVQEKLAIVMGPLSRLWKIMEENHEFRQ